MKELSRDTCSVSTIRISPAVAVTHPSYRRPAAQAAAALRNLVAQYRLKGQQDLKKTGRA